MPLDVSSQARAIRESAGVRSLGDVVLLRVLGDDARTWANGQVTNDVRALAPGGSVYALIINVKGRVLADTYVIDRGERGLAFVVPRDAVVALREHLEHYVIMEDVELELDEAARVITVQGPRSAEVASALEGAERFPAARVGEHGIDLVVPAAEHDAALATLCRAALELGGGEVGEAGWELARLRAARPRLGPDFGESTYPQEAGLEALAVSFQKGCYLGQEVICMLENRGQLSRKLVPLEASADGVEPGAAIVDGEGKEVGAITSAVRDPDSARTLALGFVKRRALEPASALRAGDVALALRSPS